MKSLECCKGCDKLKLHPCYCGGEIEIKKVAQNGGMDGMYWNWELRCSKCGLTKTYAADDFYGRKFLNKTEVVDDWNKGIEANLKNLVKWSLQNSKVRKNMTPERVIVPEMDLTAIISESRDVAKALNEFANDLERIDKKYAKLRLQENEESLCDSCTNKGCWSRYQYGLAEKHCDHYKKEG